MDQIQFDGGLKEELIFEIPKGNLELNFSDADLQKTKMLFGRYCYCRGRNGIFKINSGQLHLMVHSDSIVLSLKFKSLKTPQAFDSIIFNNKDRYKY
jgi:hypothetical protein